MAAKKIKRRAVKAPAPKAAVGRKKVVAFKRHSARKLALGPLERAGEATVDAARRLWLEAESLVTSRTASLRKSIRKANAKG
jgi:hypothetical protein